MDHKRVLGFSTSAIHSHDPSKWSWQPRILPIVTSSNFIGDSLDFESEGSYCYARSGNPTREYLEKALASLEDAKYALTFSSGMAAVTAVIQLLKPGDHIVCSDIIYGGTSHYFSDFCESQGFKISYVNYIDLDSFTTSMKNLTDAKLFWIETMANPTLQVIDVKAVKSLIEEIVPEAIFCVDNTFLTPCFMKCLNFGADIVMNSITKFINGHGDVTMGNISTNNQRLFKKLADIQSAMGFVPSVFDCYLVSRSLKTLKIRMQEHARNALAVATYLENHPKVEKVLYPGLCSHPQHELAKRQLSGSGGMVSFYIKGGKKETEDFFKKVKLVSFCASLGMAETIFTYPWTMSHYYVSAEKKRQLDITENLLRLSIGLEDIEDLISDFEQALS